jgi:hypothetical protein
MSIVKNIGYKPPGVVEWQCIEVVVDVARNQVWAMSAPPSAVDRVREARTRESARQAASPIGFAEILATMFGVPVPAAPPPDPPRRKSLMQFTIDLMRERSARQGGGSGQQAGSRPVTRSAGSRAEKLVELDRLLRESRLR